MGIEWGCVVKYHIKELRESTGMSQKKFAEMYGIPASTLRKWEQGDASPSSYVINLLARALPSTDATLIKIAGKNDKTYYYDKNQKCVLDMFGNKIYIKEDLVEIKEQNLVLYLEELFDGFYEIQEKFNRDCRCDKEEDILWS